MIHPPIGAVGNTNLVFPTTLIRSSCPLQPNDTHYNPSVGKRRHHGELCVHGLQDVCHSTNRDYTELNHFCDSSVYYQTKL